MMRLPYAKAVNLAQLSDELLAALSVASRPIAVEASDTTVWVTVPAGGDAAAVAALVAAHVPAAVVTPPPLTPGQVAAIRAFMAAGAAADLAQTVAAVRALVGVVRHRLGEAR